MTETVEYPQSLKDLLNQLNAPVTPVTVKQFSLEPAVSEAEWLRRLDHIGSEEESPHIGGIVALINEIERVRNRLKASETRRIELEQLIDADPLCPVINRRAFERELGRAISQSRRNGQPGSVLFLDLNGLKTINDRYGHAVGDRAIERCAKMLILSCRTTDRIGRLGGDEFAVIMPDPPPSGALTRGARLAELLERVPLILDNTQPLTLSAAFGAAPFNGSDDVKTVLDAADSAMYSHKQEIRMQQNGAESRG